MCVKLRFQVVKLSCLLQLLFRAVPFLILNVFEFIYQFLVAVSNRFVLILDFLCLLLQLHSLLGVEIDHVLNFLLEFEIFLLISKLVFTPFCLHLDDYRILLSVENLILTFIHNADLILC